MTLEAHELPRSGPRALLLFHDEAFAFCMITFCNLMICCQRPRSGLSLRLGIGMGTEGLLLSTMTSLRQDASYQHGVGVGWRGSVEMRNQVDVGKLPVECKTNLSLCHC